MLNALTTWDRLVGKFEAKDKKHKLYEQPIKKRPVK